MTGIRHPAKFSEPILERIADHIDHYGWPERILDPFAGTGRIHQLTAATTFGVELEPEWAAIRSRRSVCANALQLPFPDATFDCMVTSPCYGNRLADHHEARDGSRRRTYRHDLGRALHAENAGRLQWGQRYRDFHDQAWTECLRVLKPASEACPRGALIVVNVSNHIRGGEEQPVSEWHLNWFLDHGCSVLDLDVISTKRLKEGANRDARVPFENIFIVTYVAPVLTPDDADAETQVHA